VAATTGTALLAAFEGAFVIERIERSPRAFRAVVGAFAVPPG